MVPSQIGS